MGSRIDHVDGLFDPKAYLEALRERVGGSFYLVVEKILAQHEHLRADWPVHGTTGYDYLNSRRLASALIRPPKLRSPRPMARLPAPVTRSRRSSGSAS